MSFKHANGLIIGFLITGAIMASLYHAVAYRWPNEMMLLGYLLGWVTAEAFRTIVRLLERQNILLEEVLFLLTEQHDEYKHSGGR